MNISFVELVKIGLAASAVIAVAGVFIFRKLERHEATAPLLEKSDFLRIGKFSWSAKQIFLAALLFFAVMSAGNYFRFSLPTIFDKYDEYDILHYYINAKYSDELGYDNLYPALIIADAQTVNRFEGRITKYRHAANHEYRQRSQALEMTDEIRAKFSKKRWQEFVSDYVYIQPKIATSKWKTILQDRGYNATPIWNMMGRALGNMVDIDDLKLLCLVDLVLFIAMLAAIYWAFGPYALAFALIFLGVSYSFRWPVVGWSVFRYDWLAALIAGTAFMKKERYKTAGFMFGYATCMRIFPAVFMFGLIAKGIHGVIAHRSVPWSKPIERIRRGVPQHYWIMAGVMLLTIAVGTGAAMATDGASSFSRHFSDMAVHLKPENLSSQRCGLGTALVFDNTHGTKKGYIPKEKKLEVGEKVGLKYAIAFALLILLGIGATRLKDHEAVLFGFIPFFLLSIASYYYYVMRMSVIVAHAHRIHKPMHALGLALLLMIELVTWVAELTERSRYFAIGWMGWTLTLYILVMIGILFTDWWLARKADQSA